MTVVQITLPLEKIESFCERWKISEFALFGSVLRDDFHDNSDIDILVEFELGANYSLFDLVVMEDELQLIFQRDIDLITRTGISRSRNYLRRDNILNSAITIYESRSRVSS